MASAVLHASRRCIQHVASSVRAAHQVMTPVAGRCLHRGEHLSVHGSCERSRCGPHDQHTHVAIWQTIRSGVQNVLRRASQRIAPCRRPIGEEKRRDGLSRIFYDCGVCCTCYARGQQDRPVRQWRRCRPQIRKCAQNAGLIPEAFQLALNGLLNAPSGALNSRAYSLLPKTAHAVRGVVHRRKNGRWSTSVCRGGFNGQRILLFLRVDCAKASEKAKTTVLQVKM